MHGVIWIILQNMHMERDEKFNDTYLGEVKSFVKLKYDICCKNKISLIKEMAIKSWISDNYPNLAEYIYRDN